MTQSEQTSGENQITVKESRKLSPWLQAHLQRRILPSARPEPARRLSGLPESRHLRVLDASTNRLNEAVLEHLNMAAFHPGANPSFSRPFESVGVKSALSSTVWRKMDLHWLQSERNSRPTTWVPGDNRNNTSLWREGNINRPLQETPVRRVESPVDWLTNKEPQGNISPSQLTSGKALNTYVKSNPPSGRSFIQEKRGTNTENSPSVKGLTQDNWISHEASPMSRAGKSTPAHPAENNHNTAPVNSVSKTMDVETNVQAASEKSAVLRSPMSPVQRKNKIGMANEQPRNYPKRPTKTSDKPLSLNHRALPSNKFNRIETPAVRSASRKAAESGSQPAPVRNAKILERESGHEIIGKPVIERSTSQNNWGKKIDQTTGDNTAPVVAHKVEDRAAAHTDLNAKERPAVPRNSADQFKAAKPLVAKRSDGDINLKRLEILSSPTGQVAAEKPLVLRASVDQSNNPGPAELQMPVVSRRPADQSSIKEETAGKIFKKQNISTDDLTPPSPKSETTHEIELPARRSIKPAAPLTRPGLNKEPANRLPINNTDRLSSTIAQRNKPVFEQASVKSNQKVIAQPLAKVSASPVAARMVEDHTAARPDQNFSERPAVSRNSADQSKAARPLVAKRSADDINLKRPEILSSLPGQIAAASPVVLPIPVDQSNNPGPAELQMPVVSRRPADQSIIKEETAGKIFKKQNITTGGLTPAPSPASSITPDVGLPVRRSMKPAAPLTRPGLSKESPRPLAGRIEKGGISSPDRPIIHSPDRLISTIAQRNIPVVEQASVKSNQEVIARPLAKGSAALVAARTVEDRLAAHPDQDANQRPVMLQRSSAQAGVERPVVIRRPVAESHPDGPEVLPEAVSPGQGHVNLAPFNTTISKHEKTLDQRHTPSHSPVPLVLLSSPDQSDIYEDTSGNIFNQPNIPAGGLLHQPSPAFVGAHSPDLPVQRSLKPAASVVRPGLSKESVNRSAINNPDRLSEAIAKRVINPRPITGSSSVPAGIYSTARSANPDLNLVSRRQVQPQAGSLSAPSPAYSGGQLDERVHLKTKAADEKARAAEYSLLKDEPHCASSAIIVPDDRGMAVQPGGKDNENRQPAVSDYIISPPAPVAKRVYRSLDLPAKRRPGISVPVTLTGESRNRRLMRSSESGFAVAQHSIEAPVQPVPEVSLNHSLNMAVRRSLKPEIPLTLSNSRESQADNSLRNILGQASALELPLAVARRDGVARSEFITRSESNAGLFREISGPRPPVSQPRPLPPLPTRPVGPSQQNTSEAPVSEPVVSAVQNEEIKEAKPDLKALARELYPFLKRMIIVDRERLPR